MLLLQVAWLSLPSVAPVEVREVRRLDFNSTSWDEFQRYAYDEHVPVLLAGVPNLGCTRPGWLTHVAFQCPEEVCRIHQMEEEKPEWAGLDEVGAFGIKNVMRHFQIPVGEGGTLQGDFWIGDCPKLEPCSEKLYDDFDVLQKVRMAEWGGGGGGLGGGSGGGGCVIGWCCLQVSY